MSAANTVERNSGEVCCSRCRKTVVLTEDGDVQDDGTVLWSGACRGECCGLLYAGATWNEFIDVYEMPADQGPREIPNYPQGGE